MYELEQLLEAHTAIKKEIVKAIQKLKDWFNKKIAEIKDFISSFNSKIKELFKNLRSDNDTIGQDIVSKGDIIFKKGTKVSKVKHFINKNVSTIINNSKKTILDCKNGLRKLARRDTEGAKITKDEVIASLKAITAIVGVTSICISSIRIRKLNKEINTYTNGSKVGGKDYKDLTDKEREDIHEKIIKYKKQEEIQKKIDNFVDTDSEYNRLKDKISDIKDKMKDLESARRTAWVNNRKASTKEEKDKWSKELKKNVELLKPYQDDIYRIEKRMDELLLKVKAES